MGEGVEGDEFGVDPGEPRHRQQFFAGQVEQHGDEAKAEKFERDKPDDPDQPMATHGQIDADRLHRFDDDDRDEEKDENHRRRQSGDQSGDARFERVPGNDRDDAPP
jgi:hypothetical protein